MNTNILFRQNSKVILRPMEQKDLPLLRRWINNPEVSQYLTAYLPIDEFQEEEWLKSLGKRQPNDIVLGIVAKIKRPALIGNVGIHQISWKDRVATLGIFIGDCRFQNLGFGGETVNLICEYATTTLNLRKMCLSVHANNPRAIRCYEKCGFIREGVRKEQMFIGGKYLDEIQMAKFLQS